MMKSGISSLSFASPNTVFCISYGLHHFLSPNEYQCLHYSNYKGPESYCGWERLSSYKLVRNDQRIYNRSNFQQDRGF